MFCSLGPFISIFIKDLYLDRCNMTWAQHSLIVSFHYGVVLPCFIKRQWVIQSGAMVSDIHIHGEMSIYIS